ATQAPKMAIITDFMIEDNKLTSLSLIELDGSQFTVRSMRARSQSETADESLIDQFVKTYKRVNAETYAELMANPYVVDMIIPAESFHTLANGKTLWSDKEIEYDFEGRTLSGIIRSFSLTPEGTISQIRLEMISSTREGTKSKLPRTLRTLEYDVSKDRNEIEAIESNFRYFEK
ncbi:MAG TPA: hypothetical protein PLH57_04495, partial [Oligoflexia bacterium]|nr:hypothetical protein [Oligoflexia bacterium]